MPRVEIKLNLSALENTHRAVQDAALETVGQLRGEMLTAQVTPKNVGTLEGSGGATDQFDEGDDIHTTLCIGDTPYARRLYFHPEYDFQKAPKNENAQGKWAEHWLEGGDRENFVPDTFKQRMEERLK